MAGLTIAVLLATVLLGALLAMWVLRPGTPRPGWMLRLGHGGLGGVAVGLVGWFLPESGRVVTPLIWEATGLLGIALLLGLVLWRRASALGASLGMVLTLHAMIGAAGAMILAGWLLG